MKAWHDIMRRVLEEGEVRSDRTGVGTISLFGLSAEFENTPTSFPAVTTKKLAVKQCFGEMAAFIRGYDNLADFHALDCTIWDANAHAEYWEPRTEGDLGRIYGVQWRSWITEGNGLGSVDQLAKLVHTLKFNPTSRRHLVTAWNPGELGDMCLPPCHTHFQCYVSEGKYLDLQVYMRSVDLFLGLPFDVAGYALLQRLIASETNLVSRRLVFSLGDAHIYKNHVDQVKLVLSREPLPAPELYMPSDIGLFDFMPGFVELGSYQHYGAVAAEMAV